MHLGWGTDRTYQNHWSFTATLRNYDAVLIPQLSVAKKSSAQFIKYIHIMQIYIMYIYSETPSIKATQIGGLSKEVACHEG